MKNAKKLISILLAIMLTAFFVVSLFFIINFGKVDNSVYADPPISSQYYNLANISLNSEGEPQNYSDAYDKYTRFGVWDYAGLRVFAAIVNWDKETFSGKYIKMFNNVNCSGNAVGVGWWYEGGFLGIGAENRWFQGVEFDGNNCTISNFKLTPSYFYGGTADAYGFFSRIDSQTTIKNLKLSNYSLSVSSASSDYGQSAGGLVGYLNGGKIQNCIVEKFSVSASYSATTRNKMCVGGVFAVGYGTVSNCLVNNVTTSNTKSTAGIGPADYPYYIEMRGGNNVWFAYTSYYPASSSTINSCVVKSFTCSSTYAITQYVGSCDRNGGGGNISNYSHSITKCQSTAGSPAVSSYSIEGGASQGTTWYYGGSGYNDGYPYLRQFIMGWKTVNFSARTGGTVSPTSIQIPSDSNPTATKSGVIIAILGQTSTATASSGYSFSGWSGSGTSYTANFARLVSTLTFAKPKYANGTTVNDPEITISVYGPKDSTAPIKIEYERAITVSAVTASGPKSFTYNFTDAEGYNTTVTYYIPEKYNLVNSNNPGSVSSPTAIISPTIEIKKFTVTLKAAAGSNRTTDTTWTVEYNESVTYNSTNHSFTFNGSTITYTANDGYRYDGLTITKNGSASNADALIGITGNMVIQPAFARWYVVTFAKISNTTQPTSAQTMEVRENDSITSTLSTDNKTLTYKYNGTTITYKSSKFYILSNGGNTLKVIGAKTITPVTTFHACMVTMGDISSEAGTRAVSGDTYSTTTDGIFAVEYGTTVTFSVEKISAGKYKYIYTFSSGEVISYSITNNQYAMQYTLNAQGERTGMTNGLNGLLDTDSYTFAAGVTSKSITPTFGLKQYAGELN